MTPRDTRQRAALLILGGMSAVFGLGWLVYLLRPQVRSPYWFATIIPLPQVPAFTVTKAAVVVSWLAALVVWLAVRWQARATPDPLLAGHQRRTGLAMVTALLVMPFLILPAAICAAAPLALLSCLPSSALGLWAIHRMQRYGRMPVRILLAGFGWGGFVAAGFAGSMNSWWMYSAPGFLIDWNDINGTEQAAMTLSALVAGVFEELGKAAGIALGYFVFRRYFNGLVSGIVLGAAVGLGFNFSESILYMSHGGATAAVYQYYQRQSLGLMAAHVAFTALAGAGFGVARQLRARRDKALVIGCGVGAAAAFHFATDSALPHITRFTDSWAGDNQWLDTLVAMPLTIIITSGPAVLLYVLLLRKGSRTMAAALAQELPAEARTPFGAVRPDEVALLLSPRRRFIFRIKAWRRAGFGAYRYFTRLHNAQLDLGLQRWHRSRGEVAVHSPDETELRQRVLRIRARKPQLRQAPSVPMRVPV